MRPPDPAGALGVLQAAVFTDRRLRLRYRSSGHREPAASGQEAERSASVRVVDPYGLVGKAGIWYLVADSGGEPRLFRVSRVASAVVDEEPVRRRDGVSLAGLWSSLRREVEDRPAPLEVVVRGVMAARPLLSFGANVEVVSPASVRADLAAVAAEIADLYSNVRLG